MEGGGKDRRREGRGGGRRDDERESTVCGDRMIFHSCAIHGNGWVWSTFASGRGEVEVEESP